MVGVGGNNFINVLKEDTVDIGVEIGINHSCFLGVGTIGIVVEIKGKMVFIGHYKGLIEMKSEVAELGWDGMLED